MTSLVRCCSAAVLFALAAPALAAEAPAATGDPMASWRPPKVQAEEKDKKEILALFGKMEAASKKADLEAAAALIDFPVLMVTDDSKGEAQAGAWSKEQWTEVMKPFYSKPNDARMTHKQAIFVITDSLATATDSWTMTMGGKTMSGRSSTLLVRTGGAWKAKALVEGGWGDMPMPGQGAPSGGK